MTSLNLKVLALITMIIDHIGYMIFPEHFILRLIGRTAFPIYAFFVAEGVKHTSNFNNYVKRLLALAIVCQAGFYLANTGELVSFSSLNVLFTLAFGALGAHLFKSTKHELFKYAYLIFFMELAELLQTDYGRWGVLLIYSFYFVGTNPLWGIVWILCKYNILAYLMLIPVSMQEGTSFIDTITPFYSVFQISIFTIIPFLIISYYTKNKKDIALTNSQKKLSKWIFYIAYPLHFIVLYIIKLLLQDNI